MARQAPKKLQEPSTGLALTSDSQERWDRYHAKERTLNANLPPLIAAPGRSARDRIATWILMRTEEPSITNSECARRMGLTPSGLGSIISKAVKEGWLQFEDPLERIEHELIPATLDNISEMLAQKNEKITIETAKGTIFPQFRESKGIEKAAQTVLAIKIEQAPLNTSGQLVITADQIVGKPLTFSDDTE